MKVGMKDVRVRADTVRADTVKARVDAVRAIKVREDVRYYHRQAQLENLKALGMFNHQAIASPRFVLVIRIAYVYQEQAQAKH